MIRVPIFAFAALALAGAALLSAAQRPVALAQTSPGLWELEGTPDSKAPVRTCIADVVALAQYEHRGKTCTRSLITDGPGSTEIEYSCGGAGFGRSQIDVITPRALRIDTQGISGGLPFRYVIQARRVGDCPAQTAIAHR